MTKWWIDRFPLQGKPSRDDLALKRNLPWSQESGAPDPEKTDVVMLLRLRLSRIFYLRRFFDYPVSLNLKTICNLGPVRIVRVGLSYLRTRLLPARQEHSLEDFMINRFGRELYLTFFKDYTAKVWGVEPAQIPADWGAQRIKGLSIAKVLLHALKSGWGRSMQGKLQNDVETSLIDRFFYPKLGPGQLWEEVAAEICRRGGEVRKGARVLGVKIDGDHVVSVTFEDAKTRQVTSLAADYVFSSMPVVDLVRGMGDEVPADVRRVAEGLVYRDFMTVGLLLKKLKIRNDTATPALNGLVPDNWVYIQERDVKVGRLQIFNNWSPYLVSDPATVWIGLEYFCSEGDELWSMPDARFAQFAIDEVVRIDIVVRSDVIDSVVVRMPKCYPAYFGTYNELDVVRAFVDRLTNLFLVGRNGMHRYNNTDHSMLTAMTAVDNIISGVTSKDNIWAVNTEEDYHEEKSGER